ncbi:MAG: hypothetical protein R3F59_23945 [Myxococcota bacterium]
MSRYEPRNLDHDELQMELLGKKTFVVTIVGGIVFLAACFMVLM